MSIDPRIEKIISYLKSLGKYARLVDNIDNSLDPSFLFEILFANVLENNDMPIEYEVNINPINETSVDFVYREASGFNLCFELVSPEMSDELKRECTPRKTEIEGLYEYEALLKSGSDNKHLTPEALTIRMQEKLLEKVDKFPEPDDSIFSIIVVDCSNFHFGNFDGEDCRMVMFGRTKNTILQEYWEGNPIRGLLESSNNCRGAEEFRERITAVIFVPEKSINLLDKAFIVFNESRQKKHLEMFWGELKAKTVLLKLKHVPPVRE